MLSHELVVEQSLGIGEFLQTSHVIAIVKSRLVYVMHFCTNSNWNAAFHLKQEQ